MTNEGRRDKESCAEDHRKRTETPLVAEQFWGHRDLSMPLPVRQSADLKSVSAVVPYLDARSGSIRSQDPLMNCPLCGDVCICVPDTRPPAFPGSDSEVEERDYAPQRRDRPSIDSSRPSRRTELQVDLDEASPRPRFVVDDKDECVEAGTSREDVTDTGGDWAPSAALASDPIPGGDLQAGLVVNANDWREEVSARLNRYRARRHPRAPRYPSLRLKFETPESSWAPSSRASEAPAFLTREPETQEPPIRVPAPEHLMPPVARAEPVHRQIPPAHETSGKIIEFPKWSYTPPIRYSDLAEPVIDRPRILEAPEIVPPPPALGGITIEEEQEQEPERRPGIDMPLQCARLEYRWLAVLIDAAVVLLACGIFGAIYYRIAGSQPSVRQVIFLTTGALPFFWFAYQYLLIVYSGTTPGLRAMKLQLQRFDSSATDRSLRRWRVLGSVLSAISLGMGYAWQFLDEDALCWHERVTKTYLAPEKQT